MSHEEQHLEKLRKCLESDLVHVEGRMFLLNEIWEIRIEASKMTAVSGSGHSVVQIGNVYAPIVPQWRAGDKEELEHA